MVLHNENTKPTSSTSSSSLASSRVFSELQSAPWTSLMIKNQPTPIFIKSRFTDSCYYIIFTDLLRVWYRFSDKNSIKEEKLEYNPQFAATTTRILEILRDHFIEQKLGASYDCILDQKTLKMTLSLSTKIDFYMFQWAFECEQMQDGDDCHALYIRDHIIIPFIYTNKLLLKRQPKTNKHPEGGSILKRSRTSLIKTEDPVTCSACSAHGSSQPSVTPLLTKCTCSEEDFTSPAECMTQPWFDQFTSRAYQQYMVHVNDPLTRKGSMMNGVGGENKNSSSSSSSLDNEMGHLLKPALSRFYSKPDLELVYSCEEDQLDDILMNNTRENGGGTSGTLQSQGYTQGECGDCTGGGGGGGEESAEEVRRRMEIAERLERERAKKTQVQNKRKRFV